MKKARTLIPLFFLWVNGFSQRPGVPQVANLPCGNEPPANTQPEFFSEPDLEGYRSIFNGKDFSGWWNSCKTSHSSGNNGAFWRVSTDHNAIWSNQGTNAGGSILMTKAKFKNYELQWDMWAAFGNDGGIFNRTPANGVCIQTVLDYLGDRSVGGYWPEAGYQDGYGRAESWFVLNTESSIKPEPNFAKWGFPVSKWNEIWDHTNWTQVKVAIYGQPPTMKSFMRKDSTQNWTLVFEKKFTQSDINKNPNATGYIGLQVHQGEWAWKGAHGNWYRKIKLRELKDDGTPVLAITSMRVQNKSPRVIYGKNFIHLKLEENSTVSILDLQGKTLKSVLFPVGSHQLNFAFNKSQIVVVKISNSTGVYLEKVRYIK